MERRLNPDPQILFSKATWDVIHTWLGVVMIIAVISHFTIHWRWVAKVTGKILSSPQPQPAANQAS